MTSQRSPTSATADTPSDLPGEPTIPSPSGTTDDIEQEDLPTETQPVYHPPAQQPAQTVPPARQTRSGRIVRNTPRYDQSIDQRDQGLVAWEVLLDQDEREDVPKAESQYGIQKAMENPMSFAAVDNPDILYWDQAMKAHDRKKFIEAVHVELDGHEKMGNYEPILLNKVPKGTKLLDMVWSMRRKRKIKNTRSI